MKTTNKQREFYHSVYILAYMLLDNIIINEELINCYFDKKPYGKDYINALDIYHNDILNDAEFKQLSEKVNTLFSSIKEHIA